MPRVIPIRRAEQAVNLFLKAITERPDVAARLVFSVAFDKDDDSGLGTDLDASAPAVVTGGVDASAGIDWQAEWKRAASGVMEIRLYRASAAALELARQLVAEGRIDDARRLLDGDPQPELES